jgi:DNA ligase 1
MNTLENTSVVSTKHKLYKQDSKGKTRVWYAQLQGDRYRTVSGLLDGEMTETGWTTCEAKNIGRSNETTPVTQAIAEVEAEYTKKLEKGYFTDIALVGTSTIFKPMLAQNYDKQKGDVFKQYASVATQPKLDGIRCIVRADGMWTRTGKPITSCPHIFEALKVHFIENPKIVFDGELYNHDLRDNFNEITSLVRKEKPDAAEQKMITDTIQYHIYDCYIPELLFVTRFQKLNILIGRDAPDCIRLVQTKLVTSKNEADAAYGVFLADGYEGQMIRSNAPYENTRSWSLMKRKEFLDGEFEIVRIEEGNGNWAGYAKRVIFKLPDGRECGGGIRGNQDQMKALLEAKDSYVGSDVTIRYFTPTPDGMPRFPVATAFHLGKRDH